MDHCNQQQKWWNPLPSPMASDSWTNSTSENSVVSYHPLNPHVLVGCLSFEDLILLSLFLVAYV